LAPRRGLHLQGRFFKLPGTQSEKGPKKPWGLNLYIEWAWEKHILLPWGDYKKLSLSGRKTTLFGGARLVGGPRVYGCTPMWGGFGGEKKESHPPIVGGKKVPLGEDPGGVINPAGGRKENKKNLGEEGGEVPHTAI